MTEKKMLELRLKRIIEEKCNRAGCRNCDLKWEGGCSATELRNKIDEKEEEETEEEVKTYIDELKEEYKTQYGEDDSARNVSKFFLEKIAELRLSAEMTLKRVIENERTNG